MVSEWYCGVAPFDNGGSGVQAEGRTRDISFGSFSHAFGGYFLSAGMSGTMPGSGSLSSAPERVGRLSHILFSHSLLLCKTVIISLNPRVLMEVK